MPTKVTEAKSPWPHKNLLRVSRLFAKYSPLSGYHVRSIFCDSWDRAFRLGYHSCCDRKNFQKWWPVEALIYPIFLHSSQVHTAVTRNPSPLVTSGSSWNSFFLLNSSQPPFRIKVFRLIEPQVGWFLYLVWSFFPASASSTMTDQFTPKEVNFFLPYCVFRVFFLCWGCVCVHMGGGGRFFFLLRRVCLVGFFGLGVFCT